MSRPFMLTVLIASLTFVATGGCFNNGGMQPVSGTVTFKDGAPVSGGTVLFIAVEGNSSSVGYLNDDGTYTLGTFSDADGAPLGMYDVTITGNTGYGGKSPIAAKYGAAGQSQLKAEVVPGKNTIDFQLERGK